MVIYGIDGNKILDAILTESAEHEQELSKSDFVKLSWESDVKLTIPAGSYIVPFKDGLKYRLLDSYTPTETDKGFKYEPEFHHPLMLLSRIPFLYSTTDSDKNPIKQQEWSFDGLTVDALKLTCDTINEVLGITKESEKFTFTLCGTVDSSISFSVSSNDILSVLSSMAQACKDNNCEWHLSWEHKALYFGQVSVNLGEEMPLLKVHDNIQKASVSNSKESYYNCFYPQGSTKNMSRKTQVGTGNVATNSRLGLNKTDYPDGCIYIGLDGKIISKSQFEASGTIKQTLALSFDGIFPHIDLYAYNIRKRTRWLKNDTTGEYEKNPDGTNKIYTVWYMRLAYCTTIKDTSKTLINTTTDKDAKGNIITHYWYDYAFNRKKQVLQGYTLKGTFKVNTHATNNQYDALTQSLVGQPNGQDGFELYHHEEASHDIPASKAVGDSGVSILKDDYEIKFYQSGDTIIPSNESDGLYPRGNALPDFTCNIVVLFNIVMGEYETKLAQEELATRTIKEINRRAQDNNNYTAHSNPVEFARKNPNLYIGQKVTYDDGFGCQLSTRVIKLVTKLDYPIMQEITVGNQAIKGTIFQLKENVNNILSGNFSGGGLNYSQVSALVKNYTDSRFLSKTRDDATAGSLGVGGDLTVKGAATVQGDVTAGGGRVVLKEKEKSVFHQGVSTNAVTSENFTSGEFGGRGFGMTMDENKHSRLEVDILTVRMKAVFNELEKRRMTYVGGNLVLSAAGSKVAGVVGVDREGKVLKPFALWADAVGYYIMVDSTFLAFGADELSGGGTSSLYAYRCYLLADDGTMQTRNQWQAGDQAICRSFNVRSGEQASNRYYWRLVTGASSDAVTADDGKKYDYVDLAALETTDYTTADNVTYSPEAGYDTTYYKDANGDAQKRADTQNRTIWNDIPKEGDVIVQLGNRHDDERSNAILLETTGDNAPCITEYAGINGFTLADHEKMVLSPKGNKFIAESLKFIVNNEAKDYSDIVSEAAGKAEAALNGALGDAKKELQGGIDAASEKAKNALDAADAANDNAGKAQKAAEDAGKKAEDAGEKAEKAVASITAQGGKIKALSNAFETDENGNPVKLKTTAGLLTQPDKAGLVACDGKGNMAMVGVTVEENGHSVVKLGADNIKLEGLITANGNFKIFTGGSIETINATVGGYLRSSVEDFNKGSWVLTDKFNVIARKGKTDLYLPNDPEYIGVRVLIISAPDNYDTGRLKPLEGQLEAAAPLVTIKTGRTYVNRLYAGNDGTLLINDQTDLDAWTVKNAFGPVSHFLGYQYEKDGFSYLPSAITIGNGYIELLGVPSPSMLLHAVTQCDDYSISTDEQGYVIKADETTGQFKYDADKPITNLTQWVVVSRQAWTVEFKDDHGNTQNNPL